MMKGRNSERGRKNLERAPIYDTRHHLCAQRLALDHVDHEGEDLDTRHAARTTTAANSADKDVDGDQLDQRRLLPVQYEVNVLGNTGSLQRR